MHLSRRASSGGFTVVEILVAIGILAVTTIAMTQSMLVLNRNSAIARVKNLSKAMVLSRVQEIATVGYDPTANPPILPALLNVGATSEVVNIGDASTGLGQLPATLQWTIANVGSTTIRSVKCKITYTYMKRAQSYEVQTFRSPD